MLTRAIATPLWFLAGWAMTAIVAFVLGLPGVLAPIGAVLAAALIWFDPARLIWPARPRTHAAVQPAERVRDLAA